MDKKFYEKTLREDRQYSYKVIAKYIKTMAFQDAQSVIDCGCGAGWFLYYLQQYGVGDVVGIEAKNSEKAIEGIVKPGIAPFIRFRSLKMPINLKKRFDLALCIEVVEHVEEKYANLLIKNITRFSDTVIFSAATPGQGGVGHVNEQPFDYWKEKFNDEGYALDNILTEHFREFLRTKKSKGGHKIKKWYVQNIAVFRKA